MKREFRAHPLMILNLLKPFLFVLVIPVLKGLIQYILYRRISGVIQLGIAVFAAISAIAALRWRCFKMTVDEDIIAIDKGVLAKTHAVIPIPKISSVRTAQNPLDTIFRAVTFSINTEAGAKGKADFQFKLSVRDSRTVSRLLYGDEQRQEIKFSIYKVALLAATTSSAVTGLIIGVPVINRAGDLLGLALSRMLLDEINNVSSGVGKYFPPIINTVTLIFIFGYSVAFVYSFLRLLNFRVFLGKTRLEINSGVFIRRRSAFRKDCVNNVRIEQTPLMYLIKHYAMKVSVGGYGDSGRERAVVAPCGRKGEIHRQFSLYFPFLKPDGKALRAKRDRVTRARFLYLPTVYAGVIIISAFIMVALIPYFGRLFIFLNAVALAVDLYFARLCLYNYKFGKIRFGETVSAHGSKNFKRCKIYCAKQNIGEIKIIRWPADITHRTCKVEITVRSESADRFRVKHLDYNEVKKQIAACYGIEKIFE